MLSRWRRRRDEDQRRAPVPAGPMKVTLIGKPGCHLCDAARAVIEKVTGELGVVWEELDINESEELRERYWEQIPVTLVNGKQHDFWKVDEARLRAALGGAPR